MGMRELSDILCDVESKVLAACNRAGRNRDDVEIIAVTKTHGAECVREAWQAGLSIVGENKVQEAMWKKQQSLSGPQWHLIGHLQSNKVRLALGLFDCIHSVDSIKLCDRIESVACETGARPRILLEVNVSGEKSKNGMAPSEVLSAVEHITQNCPHITVEGLMTMAPFAESPEASRPYFRELRRLRDDIEKNLGVGLPHLSMGMSGDYEIAIEEGATWIRLGTVLFGERPKIKTVRSVSSEDSVGGGLDSYSGEGPTVRVLD